MIKQFSAGDITVRPFGTFKSWTIQSMDSGALDQYGCSTYYNNLIEINEGTNISGVFYPTGSPYYVAENDPVNPSGKYFRNVYSLANSMFYKYSGNPFTTFGVEEYNVEPTTGQRENRNINGRIITAAVKQNVYGETITPNTVTITDSSNVHQTYTIYDDGYTNLRLSGSYFPTEARVGGVQDLAATPTWITSSGQFVVTFPNGNTSAVNETDAKYYMEMGLDVEYTPPITGSDWYLNQATSRNYFQANNEHFGEAVSSWYKYIAVGSSMDSYSLSNERIGYASIFKFDESASYHRLVRKINFPFTQSVDGSTLFQDSFGYSVAIRDNFMAVGSPIGQACSTTKYPGFVCVYDKYKGGTDFWGIINLLGGGSNGDRFGNSVSIDDGVLAVGAPGVSGSGAVYIFRKKIYMDSGSCENIPTGSTWAQIVTTTDFCSQLSSSLIITQSHTPTFVSGNYSWQYETTLTSSILSPGDNFGWCLEVSDDKVLVGTNKSGRGYTALFTCSYHSASINSCPTASWVQTGTLHADSTYGDLNTSSITYLVDVSNTITTDGFGTTVSINGDNFIIGCVADKAFIPYSAYTGSATVLGAAYFFNYYANVQCGEYLKSFGKPGYTSNNNFARRVSVDGNIAAVTTWPNRLTQSVDYVGGNYVLEDFSCESTASEDSVLGRVTLYSDTTGTGSWILANDMKRNKESGSPFNIYGYSVSVSSNFLTVGAPIVDSANPANTASIFNPGNQTASMAPTYSGSVFVYNLNEYLPDQVVGNVFYKNGYIVMTNTSSNYQGILTGTGSAGFELDFSGSHTIYEHEYLVSLNPGDLNFSTNPTSLLQTSLAFDVNRDGIFDYQDVNLILQYLQNKQFYGEFVFDDDGILLEQNILPWSKSVLQTESEDVLRLEQAGSAASGSFTEAIYNYIQTNLVDTGILDIDGNGLINIGDGNILSLYYYNRLNPTSLQSCLDSNSTRIYVNGIKTYLNQYCGESDFNVNPEFFGYQYSSSYDPTGSFLAPYITTIGLYQDNELVVVGKLGRPIKNLVDWPINFIVRFDT